MSGAQTSTFPTMNELLAPMAAYDTHANALLQQQQRTQEITDHDIAMTGQAAAPLLNLNEDQAAAAYPGWLQDMQSRGLAKYAPPTYPGHAATQALVQRAMPILQQIQTGFVTPPGSADATKRLNDIYTGAGTAPTAPASSGAPATGGDGLTGDKAHDLPLIAQRESGGSPTVLNYVAQQDPTAYARGATASGKYQIVNSTWRDGMQLAGLDPAQYATARDAPEQVQDKVASAIYDKYGAKPWQKGPQDWVKDEQGRYQMATVRPPAGAPGGTPSVTAPGAPAAPAPYRVASNAPVPPPAPTAPAAPAAQPTYTDTETGLPVIGTQPGAPTPTPQPQAQVPQPPANRAMPGSADGPPAPTPPPAQQPPAPATRANLPRAADVPQGANSPQIQQAQRLRQAAAQIEVEAARNPYDKRLQAEAAAKAADLKQRADFLMQSDTVVQTQEGQLHPLTGKIDDPTKPIPHYVYDPTQHAYIDTTGTNKPEFEPAQRDSAVAQRDVMELGPKVANGTATQQEQARYATAVETYRQPTLRENPVTKETVRVNTRELPAGFPEPPGLGGTGSGGPAVSSGSNVVIPGYSPQQQEIERDPAKAKVADEQYRRDSKNVDDLTTGVTTAQNDNLRTKEMLDLLNNGDFSSGPGSETRTRAAAWFQRWAPASLTGWEKQSADLRGAAAAQAFQKLAFQGVTTQEKESSPRGGILATQLFQRNNPGLDLLNPANVSLLNMKLIQNQANIDYGRDALGHFTTQETRYGDTHKYSSLEQFNSQWINQRNPQVYAAAMGAISGQPPEQWTKGLSDAEYNRALDIVSRANPSAIVNTKEGRKVMQPNAPPPPPPGFSVVR